MTPTTWVQAHRALSWAFALLALALAVRRAAGREDDALARHGTLVLAALGAAVLLTGLEVLPHFESARKQALFLRSARLGWWFERKLHLSAGALWLALGAAASGLVAGGPWGRRAAMVMLGGAALLGSVATAIAGRVLHSG